MLWTLHLASGNRHDIKFLRHGMMIRVVIRVIDGSVIRVVFRK